MKRTHYIITIILIIIISGCGSGSDIFSSIKELTGKKDITAMNILGARVSRLAMESLELKKGDRMLFLTNAGHAHPGHKSTAGCIDGIIAITGCTPGSSSLGIINSTPQAPLWFALVKGSTGEAFYCQARNEAAGFSKSGIMEKKTEELFEKCDSRKTAMKDVLAEPGKFITDLKNGAFNNNLFRVTAIARAWSYDTFSNDLMRAIMLHDHFCPGLSSGIMITGFLERELPLKEGESYCIIGVPSWCKEDAFQEILDTTAGKRSLVTGQLSEAEEKILNSRYSRVAGIYIRWDKKKNKGEGLVLGFSFDALSDSKLKELNSSKLASVSKLYSIGLYMENLGNPEKCVSIIRRFTVNGEKELSRLKQTGINPLKGLVL